MWWRKEYVDLFEELDRIFEGIERSFPAFPVRGTEQPIYYGVSISTPEGKPEVRTFGNLETAPQEFIHSEEEPFTDVIRDDVKNEVIVTVEMPGVEKKDIKLEATENKIEIKAERGDRKYFKRVELDVEIDPRSTRAKYNNGILEAKAKVVKSATRDFKINVE